MQRYSPAFHYLDDADRMVLPRMTEDSESGEYYSVSEADAAIAQLITERDSALISHSKLAVRLQELEQNEARWISARDVWAAEMKAKDERIKELESELYSLTESLGENEWQSKIGP